MLPRTNVAIVASRYNPEFTDALVQNCTEELAAIMPHSRIEIIRVPGAFEIPATTSLLLAQPEASRPAAIICLGLILRGKTEHGDLIAASITNSLQSLACQHQLPVIHEVLLVDDEAQARLRCIEPDLNRGREAARAATEMVDLFSTLHKNFSRQSRNA